MSKLAVKSKKPKPKSQKVLVLRTCNANMEGFAGFKWPTKGIVKAPTKWWGKPNDHQKNDVVLGWVKDRECGGGLHGLLWGEGNGSYLSWDASAKWLVVEVDTRDMQASVGKVRFGKGKVVHCGDRLSATEFVAKNGGVGKTIAGGTATAGYEGTATAGYGGTATAGYRGTATAGDRGTATAGAGGTATAGDGGTATAGDRGTATAGDGGTATAGYRGTATAGYRGTATAGYGGTLCIRYWDASANRYRLAIGYVGENGIGPNTKYRYENGNFNEVKP